jgi:tetratricopeptide (TPR) repeat protein
VSAGRYELVEEIAHGGMGVIWRAIDNTLGREVVVKVLMDRFAPDSGTAHRFADEARITAQLQHPAIPPVHDYGRLTDDRPFLAMKLIKGRTLEDLLSQRADPTADRGRFVAVFEQVCQAVAYAHAHRVIHRDLKPGNVMVGSFGEVQVMDWGLAKVLTESTVLASADADLRDTLGGTLVRGSDDSVTQAGSILGTLAYMPPEQAAGEIGKIDQRSDVFGLGAILAVILTGEPPYAGPDTEVVRVMAIRGDLSACMARLNSCGAEPELVALCRRCLAFAPSDRPPGAGAVAKDVSTFRAATEERARAAESERAAAEARATEQRKRKRWQAAVAAAIVLILALLGVGAWRLDRQAAERQLERAVAAQRDRHEGQTALKQAQEALTTGDLLAADAALALAESRVGEDGPTDLSTLLASTKRDRDLVRELRAIDDLSWAPDYTSVPKQADVARRFRAAFARYGLDAITADPDVTVKAVEASRVSAALIAGLSEWFCTDLKEPKLRQLLDRLDPDAGRAEIRSAIQAGDEERVRALVNALDGSKVPACFAASVGFHRMVPQKDAVRLMTAAWLTHPSDYLLAYRSSVRLWGMVDRAGEMIAWAQIAVALRPDSPFAHNQLGHSFRGMHKWGDAERSIQRALELGRKYPRYAGAHVNLGNLMLEQGNLDSAETHYRAALAIDPDSGSGYFNMGLVNDRRGDLGAAEEWYRKAVQADPATAFYRHMLDNTGRKRLLVARLKEIAAGQAKPATPPEAAELAEVASTTPPPQYVLAIRLYREAFAADPKLAGDMARQHRYNAACTAVLAAAGKDKDWPNIDIEKRSQFIGQAMTWLRADLAQITFQAKDPKQHQRLLERLRHWKEDTDLVSVRDPASLAAMSPADRKEWETLWRDVDSLLESIEQQAGPPLAKP